MADFIQSSDDEIELKRVKRPRTEKQEIVCDAIEKHVLIKETGEKDIDPVRDALREERGQSFTNKGYIWQIVGEFFAVVKSRDEERDFEEAAQWYQKGVQETLASINSELTVE